MTHQPTPTDCRAWREASFDEAAFAAVDAQAAPAGHGATCAACLAWWERQRRLVGALRSLPRLSAPAALDRRTQPRELSETCTRVVLEHLRVLHAPSVLDRLVREEIEGQPGTTVRRFANELERHAAPAALDARVQLAGAQADARSAAAQRVAESAPRSRRAWWFAAGGALAAGLLGLVTYQSFAGTPRYRFEVVEIDAAGLRAQSPFGFGFANGLTGGALLAQTSPAATEERR